MASHSEIRVASTMANGGNDYGILLETSSLADDNGRPAKFVRVKDYSTEREYVIRTHPDTRSAHDGVARLWHLTEEDFNPEQRA